MENQGGPKQHSSKQYIIHRSLPFKHHFHGYSCLRWIFYTFVFYVKLNDYVLLNTTVKIIETKKSLISAYDKLSEGGKSVIWNVIKFLRRRVKKI